MLERPLLATLLLTFFVLTACGDDATLRIVAGEKTAHRGVHALRAHDFESIVLNVVAVRVHVIADDEEGRKKKGRWHELLDEEDKPFELDLIRLLDGELTQLAEGEIPAGKLTQLRFVLDARDPGWAIRTDGEEMPVRVPSGTTSGLKIQGKPIRIEEGQTRELRVDFDLQASLREEKGGTLRIRPVIQLRDVPTIYEVWDE